MSIHIGASPEEIAEVVLLPGDPLRAKYIAEEFLEGAHCYNEIRGMYGFTGTYKGKRVSVQGTGMGQPSAGIYINELINDYGVTTLIRIGSCGSIQEDVKVRDIIVALSACSDSNMNFLRFKGLSYAPTANAQLLFSVYDAIKETGHSIHFGTIYSSDTFYHDDPDLWKMWAAYNVKAIEMETAQLYTLAAKFGVKALSILTVSDHLITRAETTSQERERTFSDMIDISLSIV